MASTGEDSPVTIDVLANDTDIDGDTLSVTTVSDPANGTAVNNGDGTVTYTPDLNFTGTDAFTYTADDENGGTDTATVSVSIGEVNDPPIAHAGRPTLKTGAGRLRRIMQSRSDYSPPGTLSE